MTNTLHDNRGQNRFELVVNGVTAFVAYHRNGRNITLEHTEVPEALAGKGVGSALAKSVLEQVRKDGERVVAECEFIAGYIRKHPEYHDLLAETAR